MTSANVTQPVMLESAPRTRKGRLLAAVALLLAALFAGRQLLTWPAGLCYPGELNFIEGIPLAEMLHLGQGHAIYAPASARSYDSANFGPLYYLLGARLVSPQAPAYFPLRMLSTLATLGSAGAAGLLGYWLSRRPLAAALSALLFLSFGFVSRNGVSARSDLLALLLTFAGFLTAFKLRYRVALLLATPLLLAAFYYKQQFVAAPVAIFIFLLLERNYRRALQFVGVMALGGLLLLGLFQFVIFPGQAFLQHFVFYNLLPFERVSLLSGLFVFGLLLVVPLLVGVEYLRTHPDKLLLVYLVCAVLQSLLTVGRAGSGVYYFLECVIILCPLFGALLLERLEEPGRAAEILVLLVVTLFASQSFRGPAPSPRDFAQDRAVQDFFRQRFAPGTLALSYYTGDMVRAGFEAPITNLYHYNQLVRTGTLSDGEMVTQVENHYFGTIVLDFDLLAEKDTSVLDFYLTDRIRRAIQTAYEPTTTVEMPGQEKLREGSRFYVWVPRARTQPESASSPCSRRPPPVKGRRLSPSGFGGPAERNEP